MTTTTRKLAAIMFTDIVGYTALMGSDEDKAFSILRKNREIHSRFINQFHGTLIKEMGDGMLISFDLASDAVRCAIEIQKASKDQDVPLKIGIHEGEMVFESSDVLGDGVNIASRIQDGCSEGCILISGSVFRDVKNKPDIQTKFVSERYFKNVDEKIRIYSVTIGDKGSKLPGSRTGNPIQTNKVYWSLGLIMIIVMTIVWWNYGRSTINTEQRTSIDEREKSIAVIPFANLSNNPDNELLSDGFTHELILNLSKIKSFDRVVPFLSVLNYKKTTKPIPVIGNELGVSYILHGMFLQFGDSVHVNVTLDDAQHNNTIWTKQYRRNYKDIFMIQSQIPVQIVENIQSFITEREKESIEEIPTQNMEAYRLYQKAAVLHKAIRQEDISRDSIKQLLKRAIELDPNFAHAYGLLGLLNILDGSVWGDKPMPVAAFNSKPYVKRALEINPNEYWALIAQALIYGWAEWDYINCEKYFIKAIDAFPQEVTYRSWYGFFLFLMGRYEEAVNFIEELEKEGYKFDLTNNYYQTHIRSLLKLNRTDEASKQNQRYLKLLNEAYYSIAGEYYLFTENYDSALYYFENVKPSIKSLYRPIIDSHLATIHCKIGQEEKGRMILESLYKRSEQKIGINAFWIGAYYCSIDEIDSAFTWLEKSYDLRTQEMALVKSFEFFESLKDDPRYWELYEKTGHSEYDDYLKMKNRDLAD